MYFLLLLLPLLATFNNLNILPRRVSHEKEREKERKREREKEKGEREGEKDRIFLEGHYLQWGEVQRGG